MNSVLTVRCKLKPTASQVVSFERTVNVFTEASNFLLKIARQHQDFRPMRLHALGYHETRKAFPTLPSNLVLTALHRVARRKGRGTGGFKRGSVSHSVRTLTYNIRAEVISLSTVDGRAKMPISIGHYQRHLLSTALSIQGGQVVKGKRGQWYAHLQIRVLNTDPTPPTNGLVGVDMGIVNVVTTSDGESYTGTLLEAKRRQYFSHRRSLQKCGTKSAKRRLKKVSGRESRFRSDTNHKIAKSIVDDAKRTGRGILLEDLSGIRDRTRVRRQDRAKHAGWSFFQLREYITYRCIRDGVTLATVDPRNTSRTCSACGHCEKANRRNQAEFICRACGYRTNADVNAARNVARAPVKERIVGEVDAFIGHAVLALQAA